jgi:RNA recognition motif-containing protein
MSTQPHTIDGKQVECKNAIPKEAMQNSPENSLNSIDDSNSHSKFNAKKIFVGGLPPALTEDELRDYFQQFGEVSQCLLMMDKSTKKSRGFGFVIYLNESVADTVMNLSLEHKHSIKGKIVSLFLKIIYLF